MKHIVEIRMSRNNDYVCGRIAGIIDTITLGRNSKCAFWKYTDDVVGDVVVKYPIKATGLEMLVLKRTLKNNDLYVVNFD